MASQPLKSRLEGFIYMAPLLKFLAALSLAGVLAEDRFIAVEHEVEELQTKLAVPRRKPGRRPSWLPKVPAHCPRRRSSSSSSSSSSSACYSSEEPEDDGGNPFPPMSSGYLSDYSSRCGDSHGECGFNLEDSEPWTNWIEDMDFYHTVPILEGPGQNWHYISIGNFTANGGHFITGHLGGFLDAHVYTVSAGQTSLPELDHLKFLVLADKHAQVPGGNKLVVDWKASGETFGTGNNPFGCQLTRGNDPRLASAGFMSTDPATGISYNFLLTSDRVYVMYTRQPYMRLILGKPYAAFTYIFPVKIRSKEDVHRLRVEFDDQTKTVSWFVDYRQVFKLQVVGARLKSRLYLTGDYGGYSDEDFPKYIEYGFGAFTFLDQYPVCHRAQATQSTCEFPPVAMGLVKLGDETQVFPQYNPAIGMPAPARYWDNDGLLQNRLWGQGSESRIYQLSVFQIMRPF